jgi:hypothetical protein
MGVAYYPYVPIIEKSVTEYSTTERQFPLVWHRNAVNSET